jgi:glycosyltransferase involved in cell wall biosynthesis
MMNILMLTNTYLPHVGGVARSVSGLTHGLKQRGHKVLVIAPEFPGAHPTDEQIFRVAALQQFAGSDFSVPLPLTWQLSDAIDAFKPDLVHTHHPFLLGDTALRVAASYQVPILFTYHTRYELYGHYVAQDSDWLKRLVLSLAHGYCDLCDHVIAPSRSIQNHLIASEVHTPISVIPTGIDITAFSSGDGARGRRRWDLPQDGFVVGHIGRLAPEKNLELLTEALITFLNRHNRAHCLITGDGNSRTAMQQAFQTVGLDNRVRFTGVLTGQALYDAYASQDAFAFTSISETQGLVLAEAMAAGVPVIALDAPGVREVVRDGQNGRLLPNEATAVAMADVLSDIASAPPATITKLREAALQTAHSFSADTCLDCLLQLYADVLTGDAKGGVREASAWETARRRLEREFDIVSNLANAISDAVLLPPTDPRPDPGARPNGS